MGNKRSDRGDRGCRTGSTLRSPVSSSAATAATGSIVSHWSASSITRHVSSLEDELEGVAHAGGALIIDLRELDSVDEDGVRVLEETASHAGQDGWWLFIVNSRGHVRDAFEQAGADLLLSDVDVSEVLASGDGEWSPTSLPPSPGERKIRRLRVVRERA